MIRYLVLFIALLLSPSICLADAALTGEESLVSGASCASCDTGSDSSQISNTGTSNSTISGTTWKSQGFTTTANGLCLTEISLDLGTDNDTGSVVVSIRADDGGDKPTGADISGSTVTTALNTVASTLVSTLLATVTLDASTKYHIVMRAISGGSFEKKYSGSNNYADGLWCGSTDSGSLWTTFASVDSEFDIYGCEP